MEYKELILEMLNRIVKLEKEVDALKKANSREVFERPELKPIVDPHWSFVDDEKIVEPVLPMRRDKTRYMFNGYVYLKNRLVLAIVKDYVSKNQNINCDELKEVFDKSLQGSIGVVEREAIAKQRTDYRVRFFADDDEILRLTDGNMLVCSQWGILNIPNFINRAEQMGYCITPIERK